MSETLSQFDPENLTAEAGFDAAQVGEMGRF